MASWNIPALANKISDDVPAIKALLIALFKWTDNGTTDIPSGAKRLQSVTGGVQLQSYSGSSWANVGKLIHDCDTLDGKHATSSATANTIPVRDSNGKLAGDVLGNANTATTASGLASGYVVPVANGGTGANSAAGARTNLGTNNAANITTGVLAVERGGTGSGTKNFVDLSTNQTIGGNKTFSGEVTLNRNVLKMAVLDTTENSSTTRTDTVITGISSNSGYGISAMFGAAGNAVIGAGEGKASLLAELAGNTGEDVYIIADGAIHFHPNANTYANRKSILLNASGELSGLAKVTATSFAGNLTGNVTGNVTGNCSGSSGSCTGNAKTATTLATARTVRTNLASTSTASFNGSANIAPGVTGTLPIGNGGTGATTRLAALKALTNENVGSSAAYFLTITNSWGKGGYSSVSDVKSLLGLGNYAFKSSGSFTGASINGATLTGTIVIQNLGLRVMGEAAVKGTAPANDFTHFYQFHDKNSKALCGMWCYYYTSKATAASLRAYKANASGDTASFSASAVCFANGTTTFRPSNNGAASLGYEGYKWKDIYCGNATIHTSDERLKDRISAVPDRVLDAWERVSWRTFVFKDAAKEKGAKARVHSGLIAQEIERAFKASGMDASRYAFFCHHSWDAQNAVIDEEGNVAEEARKAGDEYALRYEECLCIEAAYQRRRADWMERRIAELERRIAATA